MSLKRRCPVGRTPLLADSLVVVALAWLLIAPAVQADVVGPPPDYCPSGTEGTSSHCGSYCGAQLCADSSECTGSEICQPLPLCLAQTECSSHWDPDAAPTVIDTANSSCAGGTACASGTCETVNVCATDQSGEAIEVDQGCGCTLIGGHDNPRGWWLLPAATLLGLMVWRRRSS